MVTRAQIEKLGARIESIAAALTPPEQTEYVVYLRFGESDAEFLAKYPDYPLDGRGVINLAFGDDVAHSNYLQQQHTEALPTQPAAMVA